MRSLQKGTHCVYAHMLPENLKKGFRPAVLALLSVGWTQRFQGTMTAKVGSKTKTSVEMKCRPSQRSTYTSLPSVTPTKDNTARLHQPLSIFSLPMDLFNLRIPATRQIQHGCQSRRHLNICTLCSGIRRCAANKMNRTRQCGAKVENERVCLVASK